MLSDANYNCFVPWKTMLIFAYRTLLSWTMHCQYIYDLSLILLEHSKSAVVLTLDTAKMQREKKKSNSLSIHVLFYLYKSTARLNNEQISVYANVIPLVIHFGGCGINRKCFHWLEHFWLRIQDRRLAAFFLSLIRNAQEAKETKNLLMRYFYLDIAAPNLV